MRWTGRLEGLPRFISQAFDLAQAPRKGMGSSLLKLWDAPFLSSGTGLKNCRS